MTLHLCCMQAVVAYSASNPEVTSGLQSGSGKAAVSAHVIPDGALSASDIKEGETTFNTVAGTPLIISKT
jgi:ATP-dependent RNA helicase DDX18/HAS1